MQIYGGKRVKMVLCFGIYIQSSLMAVYRCTISNLKKKKNEEIYPSSLIPAYKIFEKYLKKSGIVYLKYIESLHEK